MGRGGSILARPPLSPFPWQHVPPMAWLIDGGGGSEFSLFLFFLRERYEGKMMAVRFARENRGRMVFLVALHLVLPDLCSSGAAADAGETAAAVAAWVRRGTFGGSPQSLEGGGPALCSPAVAAAGVGGPACSCSCCGIRAAAALVGAVAAGRPARTRDTAAGNRGSGAVADVGESAAPDAAAAGRLAARAGT